MVWEILKVLVFFIVSFGFVSLQVEAFTGWREEGKLAKLYIVTIIIIILSVILLNYLGAS